MLLCVQYQFSVLRKEVQNLYFCSLKCILAETFRLILKLCRDRSSGVVWMWMRWHPILSHTFLWHISLKTRVKLSHSECYEEKVVCWTVQQVCRWRHVYETRAFTQDGPVSCGSWRVVTFKGCSVKVHFQWQAYTRVREPSWCVCVCKSGHLEKLHEPTLPSETFTFIFQSVSQGAQH